MNSNVDTGFKYLKGRSFIIGREGHIYVDSPSASKQHAEIKVVDGQIYLRDLNSSNGTYLLRNNHLKFFESGFVSLLQPVVIGNHKYIIRDLLEIAESYALSHDATTDPNNKSVSPSG